MKRLHRHDEEELARHVAQLERELDLTLDETTHADYIARDRELGDELLRAGKWRDEIPADTLHP